MPAACSALAVVKLAFSSSPNCRAMVGWRITGTPATNERFCRAPAGNSYGAALVPENVTLTRRPYRTSLDNLWMVNATAGRPSVAGAIGAGARLYRDLTGDDVGAINTFNMVLANDGRNGDAWFNLGMVLFGQSQFAEAEDCFRRASELAPNDAQTWNNRGVCLHQMQRVVDAKACFLQALRIDSNDADAKFNLQNLA